MSDVLRRHRLLQCHGLSLYVLPGSAFEPVSEHIGILRELTYSQKQLGSGSGIDLDGRDAFYHHFLLIEERTLQLAGTARLQFVQRTDNGDLPTGSQSYLEHVYPGIKRFLAIQGNHIEIGRVAIAPVFQRHPAALMTLFRGAIQLAVCAGRCSLHGLVSYNHLAYPDIVNRRFLESLMAPPFVELFPEMPLPRYPHRWSQPTDQGWRVSTVQELEIKIKRELDASFRLPVLLRQYINLVQARVRNISLAKDFNQVTEIYMCADIRIMPENRLSHFLGPQPATMCSLLNPYPSGSGGLRSSGFHAGM